MNRILKTTAVALMGGLLACPVHASPALFERQDILTARYSACLSSMSLFYMGRNPDADALSTFDLAKQSCRSLSAAMAREGLPEYEALAEGIREYIFLLLKGAKSD